MFLFDLLIYNFFKIQYKVNRYGYVEPNVVSMLVIPLMFYFFAFQFICLHMPGGPFLFKRYTLLPVALGIACYIIFAFYVHSRKVYFKIMRNKRYNSLWCKIVTILFFFGGFILSFITIYLEYLNSNGFIKL